MKTLKFTYWQDGSHFIGHLNDFSEYETQGESKEELMENLRSLLVDIESGTVSCIRYTEDLVVA